MIRVNLLEVREERRRLAVRNFLIASAAMLLLTLTIIFVWHGSLSSEIADVRQEIARVQSETRKLEKIVGQVEQIKKKKDDVEKKLATIRGLETNRMDMVDLLLAFADVLLDETWVTEMSVENRQIQAKAKAIDMQSIGLLVKKLRADGRFSNPRVSNIKVGAAGGNDGGAIGFELSVAYVGEQSNESKQAN
ncbi:MAG: hypothetical protein D6761_08835 [Candidatus Dadabacteria bacterium]|nr:MAG: hypothetical protein D6761_08835 [Candidatus Dadabacteria bacterium]